MQTLAQTARRAFSRLGPAFGLALVFALAAAPAQAATWTVVNTNDTGDGSLRHAIDTLAAAGDTIDFNLPPNATIVLGSTLTVAKNLTIDGGNNVTVSGGNAVRVFTVNAGVTAIFGNLAIVGGSSTDGGGIHNGGTLTLNNCTVAQNTATGGNGGGIYNDTTGALALTGSAVSGNTATGGGGGGGIFNSGTTLTLTTSVVSGNTSDAEGGGIDNSAGTATLTASTVGNNTTGANGGGIANHGTLNLTASTVSGNTAANGGGGILNDGAGTLTLSVSTIAGNSAASAGGIANGHAMTATGVTLAGNTNADFYNEADATLQSTIIQSCAFSGTAAVTDNGGNRDGGSGCGFAAGGSGTNLDLGPLQDNGGPTLTMLPGAGSAAIGAGVACAAAQMAPDQRGAARPAASCTSGAVEAGANAPQFRMTVQVTGEGSVSDNATPAQIVKCATSGYANCTGLYAASASVQLTATPAAGQAFTGWSGACSGAGATATVTMSQARTCIAGFAPQATATSAAVPTLNPWALLLLLAALLAAAGMGAGRARRR